MVECENAAAKIKGMNMSDILWVIFIIGLILYSCTDRHFTYEFDGVRHEIYIDKPSLEPQPKD